MWFIAISDDLERNILTNGLLLELNTAREKM